MRLRSMAVMTLLAAATLGATATVASAQSCLDLWVERNSYYKDAGYCFKTSRAISYFGNAGCSMTMNGMCRSRVGSGPASTRLWRWSGPTVARADLLLLPPRHRQAGRSFDKVR